MPEPRGAPARFIEAARETFDIWHEVPMVPQLTGMSCWAAAAAMIVGWRDCLVVDPREVAEGLGAWESYRDGLEPADVPALARTFSLVMEAPRAYAIDGVRRLLGRYGPLWVGAGPTGLHVVVVSGMYGDGTLEGTHVRVLDPWPIDQGERYTVTFRELAEMLEAVTDIAGVRAAILHSDGRARGAARAAPPIAPGARLAGGGRAPSPRYGTPLGLFRLYQPRGADAPLRGGDAMLDDRDWYPATPAELDAPDRAPPPRPLIAGWAEDARSPDYRHLDCPGLDRSFSLTAAHIARLAALNAFALDGAGDLVLFGLRGCRLTVAAQDGAGFLPAVDVGEDVPDHVGLRCVLGVWRRSTGELAAFQGSTVPNVRFMEAQRQAGRAATRANLLPTGKYLFRLGDHRFVKGALLIQPDVLVLRSYDDLVYDTADTFQRWSPADNIHPAFSDPSARFSSAGCQTIPGAYSDEAGHTGAWAVFHRLAGATADAAPAAASPPLTYLLLTGRDARLIAERDGGSADEGAMDPRMARLRFGSSGAAVRALQTGLRQSGHYQGAATGTLDAPTALALVDYQREREGGTADAIVTPTEATELGFDLAGQASVAPAAFSGRRR